MSLASDPRQRVVGYDAARGLAFLGMVYLNFSVVMVANRDRHPPADWLAWMYSLVSGRASGLFVLLAGAGLSLMSRRAREADDPGELRRVRNVVLRRAFLLFVGGLLYVDLWVGEILHYYGAYFAVGAFLLGATRRQLAILALEATAAFVALYFFLDYWANWDWNAWRYHDFWTADGFVRHLFFNGPHPLFPWLAFLFAGMIVGRIDWSSRRRRWIAAAAGLAIALGAEGASALLRGWLGDAWWMGWVSPGGRPVYPLFETTGIPPTPLYILTSTGSAIFALCVCLEFADRFPNAAPIRALAATGQLALTLYVAHVFAGMGFWEWRGDLREQTLETAAWRATATCALSVAFAVAWRRWFQRGPLEWLLRRIAG